MKKSFILYLDLCETSLDLLNNEQAGELFRAIVANAKGEDMTPTDGMAKIAYAIIKNKMDEDEKAYQEVCAKRSEAGKRGNQMRWGQSQNIAKIANAKNVSQSIAKIADNDNDNDNEDTNVSNNKDSKESMSIGIDYPKLLAFFNAELKRCNSVIPQIKSLSDARKKALHARMREHGKDALVIVIKKSAQSDFLNGKNNRNFVATFDWMMKPTNFPKVLEGNYDNPEKPSPRTQPALSLMDNVKAEREQREKKQKLRILSLYDAAEKGDARSIKIISELRKKGELQKYGLN